MRTKAPVWATKLIKEVCRVERVPVPDCVTWYQCSEVSDDFVSDLYGGTKARAAKWLVSGDSFGQHWTECGDIDIFAGTDKLDQKVVLLHEMAHYVVTKKRGDSSHNSHFWDTAFRLWSAHDIPLGHLLWREATDGYRRRSIAAWLKRQGLMIDPLALMSGTDSPTHKYAPVAA